MFIFGHFSILGGVIVIVGLYMLLWGKEGDPEAHLITSQEESYPIHGAEKGHKTQIFTSDEGVLKAEP